jgi:prepilin-type processing-associated H-X9-DG protein
MNHEQAHGFLPGGGWGQDWIGNPDWGFGGKQSGGWVFSVLPYMEMQALYDVQSGKTASTSPTRADAASRMMSMPVSAMYCPSRRPAMAYDTLNTWQCLQQPKCADGILATATPKQARADYAMNAGTRLPNSTPCGSYYGIGWGPATSTDYDAWIKSCVVPAGDYDGVSVPGNAVRVSDICDGMSNTCLVAEKYLNPDNYATGAEFGDNQSMYIGDNAVVVRWGGSDFPPFQDRVGYLAVGSFGSAHAGNFNMAMCDGSVSQISYSIDVETYRRLMSRKDGQPIDGSVL